MPITTEVAQSKTCSRCHQEKPLTAFYVSRRSSDGRVSWCVDCVIAVEKAKRLADPDRFKKLRKAYYDAHREQLSVKSRESRQERRATVIHHYSRGTNKCACCGESTSQFLCIDHVDGGSRHRRDDRKANKDIYKWLLKNGLPDGFRVLCHNCNMARGFYGQCPHEVERARVAVS